MWVLLSSGQFCWLPGSSPHRIQGNPKEKQCWQRDLEREEERMLQIRKQRRERKKEKHGGTRLLWNWSWSVTLFFREAFIPWFVHKGKWKMQSHAESAQTLHLFCLYRNQDFFLHTFPINNVVYIIFWPWRPVDILWPSFDEGCSTRKLIFPWNVFLYISNLCQPQKILNRVTFLTEQRCSELQERTN